MSKGREFMCLLMADAMRCWCLSYFQVLNKLLALAATASQQKFASNTWSNVLISTNSVQLLCVLVVLYVEIALSLFVDVW